jgi:hypothetical protein
MSSFYSNVKAVVFLGILTALTQLPQFVLKNNFCPSKLSIVFSQGCKDI